MSGNATVLDEAHAAMKAAPDDDSARMGFYGRLAGSELVLLLEKDPAGETISPRVFELENGPVVLAFDLPERLSEFVGAPAPSATLPGRQLIRMLAGQGIGLGVNLDIAPSATLLGADALEWLAGMLAEMPAELRARPETVEAPRDLPEALLRALDAMLGRTGGLAASAYLVAVTYEGGARSHMLGIVDPVPGAEETLVRAAADALKFSGLEAGQIDTAFFRASDPVCAKLARVGLRFDLPEPPDEPPERPAPGSDPDRPPILR